MKIDTHGGERATPLTGAALLKNLRAKGELTCREVELIAALQNLIADVLSPNQHRAVAGVKAARAAIAKATNGAA